MYSTSTHPVRSSSIERGQNKCEATCSFQPLIWAFAVMNTDGPVVVFDGLCNFCSSGVKFILRNDRSGQVRFAAVQSRYGARLLEENGVSALDPHTFLVVNDGHTFFKSDAAIEISRFLGVWRVLGVVRIVPGPIRDIAYDMLAKNRYKWFGKRDKCFLPTEQERGRFVD